ncbi:hypothetical protein POTOM_006658 [Populus tomentosa]|uniref:Cyclic nucleotide-binding domain-containing protein n=1 Tax=Populus tomentosa TaxID=118781 RepID=A0A8X8ATP4_POPTO|nr:hypothetical protein POTOM_006658 [Populus tomentosa]
MASEHQENSNAAQYLQYFTDEDSKSEEDEGEDEEEEEEDVEEESPQDCKGMFLNLCGGGSKRRGWSLGQVLDPRGKWVQEWNRVFLLVCATGLFVDPLFFYVLSISDTCMCLFVDGWFAITVTALRCMTDVLYLWNMWLQLKIAKRPHGGGENGGDGERGGSRVAGPCSSALRYLKAKKGFFFDLFVILPLPQNESVHDLLKLTHRGYMLAFLTADCIVGGNSISAAKRISNATDERVSDHFPPPISPKNTLFRLPPSTHAKYLRLYIWNCLVGNRSQHDCLLCCITLTVKTILSTAILRAAAGACWYLLGIQRAAKCLKEQCMETPGCGLGLLSCKDPIYYGTTRKVMEKARWAWADNKQARSMCLDSPDKYDYGAYKWTVQLVTNDSRLEKILFPIFWGLMTLSTFGNLESTTEWLEVVFNIIVLTSGLLLVTMLIGNIKVFLHATTSKKQAMQLKMRNIEWWMRKRHLPTGFRQRVRNYERQRWAAMRGVDECEMIRNLPEGLRRDIKYHLCLDLVRQVPLFQHMDDLVLENICDRVKSLIFTKGETITREGDPVQRMLFVVRGHLQSSQVLRDGVKSCCMLGPGNFSGDELLSWCLRRPFIERLPPSSSTLVTLETTEAFGLEAEDVKYVTQHFRYTFVKERVKRSARYYSPGWRTWAAVAIQLAWRRYKHRLTLTSLSFIRPRRPLSRCSSLGEDRLRLYTALLTSPKPNQDDFDF